MDKAFKQILIVGVAFFVVVIGGSTIYYDRAIATTDARADEVAKTGLALSAKLQKAEKQNAALIAEIASITAQTDAVNAKYDRTILK